MTNIKYRTLILYCLWINVSFIYANNILLSTCYVSSTFLDAWDTSVDKTNKKSLLEVIFCGEWQLVKLSIYYI